MLPQIVVVLLILGLAGAMAIEPTRQLFEQRARISEMTEQLRRTRHSNRQLERRIDRLKDPDFLEQQAREQIGLVRPGETAYVVMPPTTRARRHHRRPHRPERRAVASPPTALQRLVHFIGLD